MLDSKGKDTLNWHSLHSSFLQKSGYVTVSDIKASLKWETERARQVLVCDFWNGPEKMGPRWEEEVRQVPHRQALWPLSLCWLLAWKAAAATPEVTPAFLWRWHWEVELTKAGFQPWHMGTARLPCHWGVTNASLCWPGKPGQMVTVACTGSNTVSTEWRGLLTAGNYIAVTIYYCSACYI